MIYLRKFEDSRGKLSFIEENKHIPPKIKRTFWIYDVPGGQIRAGHAYKEKQELIVALSLALISSAKDICLKVIFSFGFLVS